MRDMYFIGNTTPKTKISIEAHAKLNLVKNLKSNKVCSNSKPNKFYKKIEIPRMMKIVNDFKVERGLI